ncbi:MAG: GNAT family N-acetyltransferase [Coprobacillus sp.]
MQIRKIEKKDNEQVEQLIRTCLIEFNANQAGCAWEDDLSHFYEFYQDEKSLYLVVEDNGKIVAGCGIGQIEGYPDICELQKMYAYKETRGSGIAQELLDMSLEFARKYYKQCYLDTFEHMVAANRFYIKNGFVLLDQPLIKGPHYACDKWYIRDL